MRKTLELIASDLKAKAEWTYGNASRGSVLKTLATDGTQQMIVYRLMQGARRAKLAPLEILFNKINVASGCVIGRGTEFGPGFVLVHSNGIVINGSVRGGSNVRLEHQVTMGTREKDDSPTLGDDIYIGAGAKIIGSINVGSGARVGANAVVLKDVPPATTVVGVPAKPVPRRSVSKLTS